MSAEGNWYFQQDNVSIPPKAVPQAPIRTVASVWTVPKAAPDALQSLAATNANSQILCSVKLPASVNCRIKISVALLVGLALELLNMTD